MCIRDSHYPVNRQLIRRGLRGAEGNDWRMPSRPGNPLRALGTNGAGSALGAGGASGASGASGAGLALGAGRALRTSRPYSARVSSWPLRPGRAVRSRRTRRTLNTLGAGRALRACWPRFALRAGRTAA